MRISIVGCGNQGAGMAGMLAHEPEVDKVVVIARDAGRLQRAVETVASMGRPGGQGWIEGRQADPADVESLARAAEGSDLILNATVPALNMPVMKACLRLGAHYMDLYSYSRALPGAPDSETVEAQLELNNDFEQAGLSAFPCLGISPGWTTLAARYLADGLDTVDSVIVRNVDWIESKDLLALCIPEIMLSLWLSPPGPVYLQRGEVRSRGLLESEELYEFPQPVGSRHIYTITSLADAVLTSRFIGKPVGLIEEKGALLSGGLSQKDIWITALQRQTAAEHPEMAPRSEPLLTVLGSSFGLAGDLDIQVALREGTITDGAFASVVEVTGARDGRTFRRTISCVSTLRRGLELVPWAVAAAGIFATVGTIPVELLLMLCRGESIRRGVLPVTSIENPAGLFERMKQRGHRLVESSEALVQ